MLSKDGRYVVIFNGEIYNFADLKKTLIGLGRQFEGSSDTEVLLSAISEWGLEAALRQFQGMFAFALWDAQKRALSIARDRLGEKPIYFGWQTDYLLFGSELKALRAHPAWNASVDRTSLHYYLRNGYIPAPHSIYQRIYKLIPGAHITFDLASFKPGKIPNPSKFWSLRAVAEDGLLHPFSGTDVDAVQTLDHLLKTSVGRQMVSDVPLGAFLSGGIDSSLIVALMQTQSSRPVKTFTIGFSEKEYNEAQHAKAVSSYLGTDHTEFYAEPKEAMAVIPKLPKVYDEPFSDASQIPTCMVSSLARGFVTVSLSGDGGDELFGGYRRYSDSQCIWKLLKVLPSWLKQFAVKVIRLIPAEFLQRFLGWLAIFSRHEHWRGRVGDRLHKMAEIMNDFSAEEFYLYFISLWKNPAELLPSVQGFSFSPHWSEPLSTLPTQDLYPKMMLWDSTTYLPDDILVKVDRASMSVGLECRVPMLDPRVIEFAWQVPLGMKLRNKKGKWLLRELLNRYIPREITDRPKMGFGVPLGAWLRDPLREWADDLLNPARLLREQFFNPAPITKKWTEHKSGQRNWEAYLWNILMFQLWLQEA
jgi:asparagine synthase (glutamine-hydrolysing)